MEEAKEAGEGRRRGGGEERRKGGGGHEEGRKKGAWLAKHQRPKDGRARVEPLLPCLCVSLNT